MGLSINLTRNFLKKAKDPVVFLAAAIETTPLPSPFFRGKFADFHLVYFLNTH
jgi:hypothetical protein